MNTSVSGVRYTFVPSPSLENGKHNSIKKNRQRELHHSKGLPTNCITQHSQQSNGIYHRIKNNLFSGNTSAPTRNTDGSEKGQIYRISSRVVNRTGSHDLGTGSHDLGTGSHDLGTGSHDLGTGSHDLGTGKR